MFCKTNKIQFLSETPKSNSLCFLIRMLSHDWLLCMCVHKYSNFVFYLFLNKSVFLTIFFLVVFFPLVSIVALLAATDAIITLSQNAIWALYVGCLLKGAIHNIHINSIHQLLEPSCHNKNTCSYFLFTAAAPEQGKQKYGNSCLLSKKRL